MLEQNIKLLEMFVALEELETCLVLLEEQEIAKNQKN